MTDDLFSRYASIDPADQRLVETCAVAHGGVSVPVLAQVLDRDLRQVDRQVRALAKRSLVQRNHRHVWASEELAEPLRRHLYREGRYASVLGPLAKADPYRAWSWTPGGAPSTLVRDLRGHVLAGDPVAFFKGLHAYQQHTGHQPNVASWFVEPFESELIGSLPPSLSGFVLDQMSQVEFIVARGPRFGDALSHCFARHPESPSLRGLVARHHLLAGELDAAEQLGLPADEDHGLLAGWLALAQGTPKPAARIYAKALAARRKAWGTRDVRLPGPEGLLLPLAYLLDGTPSRHKQAGRLLDTMIEPSLDPTSRPEGALYALWEMVGGAPMRLPTELDHPFVALFAALGAAWSDRSLPGSVEPAVETARTLGWRWVADEIEAAMWRDPARSSAVALVGHRQGVPAWERKLEVLESLSPSGRATAVPEGSDRRVAWTVWHHGSRIHLEAREQKRSRKGWSVGRKVALSRLKSDPGSVKGLTDQDRQIVGALRHRQYRNYRGYPEDEYTWAYDAAWPALVGHPALFDAHDEVPLEVVDRSPQLTLTPRGQELVLAIDPPMTARVLVEEARPGRFVVTTFDKAQAKLAEAIGDALAVPRSAVRRVGALLERFSGVFEVHDGAAASQAETVEADRRPVLQLVPFEHGLAASPRVRPLGPQGPSLVPGEGAGALLVRTDAGLRRAERDLQGEVAASLRLPEVLPALASAAWDGSAYLLPEPVQALELLADLLASPEAVVAEWPEGQPLRLRALVEGRQFRMSVVGKDQWFEARGEVQVDEDLVVQIQQLIDRLRSAQGRFVQLEDGQYIALSASLRRRLDALSRAGRATKKGVKVHRLAGPVLDGLLEEAGTTRVNAAYKEARAAFAQTSAVSPPATLQAQLRPYQVDGLQWLARMTALGAGVCLADDMGLGKTIQVLAWILHAALPGPVLVIAPTSVCGGWVEQAWRFAPSLRVLRFGAGDRDAMIAEAGAGDLVVCSYGLLQADSERLSGRAWAAVVLDEAQAIKNASTQRHQAAVGLQAPHRIALTGTPIENRLEELHALFTFLNPGMLGSEDAFRKRFARPIELGNRDVTAQLRQLVLPFVLRRAKSAVLEDLPPKTEIVIEVEPTPEEVAFYEALRREALDELANLDEPNTVQILERLMRLRQACCSPRLVAGPSAPPGSKLEVFQEVVQTLQANRHRALVFSQFVGHLAILRAWLDEAEVPYQYLDGSTPAAQRDARVRAFQAGEGDLFLISLRAGGTGLNLTAADYVLHMDPWWNPAVEDQASDRAHRIGQTRPVTVYRFIVPDTVEAKMLELHHAKRDLADQLLAGAEMAARLTPEQLMALLGRG